jgi:hypothetical protein
MGDFNIRADSVDVEQIMEQIRARIREKRGVDYTEQEVRELATAKLERFLGPDDVPSDLLRHFRERTGETAAEDPLFESHRAIIRWTRRLLRPILKLFFNPNALSQTLHAHGQLTYEVLHNLVVETTRLSIEVRNLKMRVESLSSRIEFDERRSHALEGVVQYRPGTETLPVREAPAPGPSERGAGSEPSSAEARGRRRRRRRGHRSGQPQGPPGDRHPASGAPDGTEARAAGPQAGEPQAGEPGPGDDERPPDHDPDPGALKQ